MHRRTVASLASAASAAIAFTAMAVTPATAYSPNPWIIGKNSAQTQYCPCQFPDKIDGTYFQKDDGGVGAKEVYGNSAGHPLAKAEFHPHGEILWLYDVSNDGDGLYYKVSYEGDGGRYGLYTPPGTSNAWDIRKVNLDIPEGRRVTITVYDDRAMTDKVSQFSATA